MIVEPAPAKINLALHVRRRRPDGYHDLETLFAFATDGDMVTLDRADHDSFTITGPFARALNTSPARGGGPSAKPMVEGHWPDDNLVTKAATTFRTHFATNARYAITLDKRLPIASGIGGGSADAAATLRGLAKLHGIAVDDPALFTLAAALGADVPACLLGRTTLGEGKGDTLHLLGDDLAGTPLLLVNPGVAVSTAAVFAAWDGIDRGPLPDGDLLTRAQNGRNDLEPPARVLAPAISDVLAMLDAAPSALLARMSGSGATCFGLFSIEADRDRAAAVATRLGWWTLSTTLAEI